MEDFLKYFVLSLFAIVCFCVIYFVVIPNHTTENSTQNSLPRSPTPEEQAAQMIRETKARAEALARTWCAGCGRSRSEYTTEKTFSSVSYALEIFATNQIFAAGTRQMYAEKSAAITKMLCNIPLWSSSTLDYIAGSDNAKTIRQNLLISAFYYHMCGCDETDMLLAPNILSAVIQFIDLPCPGEPSYQTQYNLINVDSTVKRLDYHMKESGAYMFDIDLLELEPSTKIWTNFIQDTVVCLLADFYLDADFVSNYLHGIQDIFGWLGREANEVCDFRAIQAGDDTYKRMILKVAGVLTVIGATDEDFYLWPVSDIEALGKTYLDSFWDLPVLRRSYMSEFGKINSKIFFVNVLDKFKDKTGIQ